MSDDRLLTAAELADLLGLKPGTVLDKWERGELPGYKIGRVVRFDREEVLARTYRPALLDTTETSPEYSGRPRLKETSDAG